MQPGEGGLAGAVEAVEGRAAARVGDDAAAHVVRGGHHGDRLARQVDAQLEAAGVDRREALAQEVRWAMGDVEQDVLGAAGLHLVVDRARDDVARGQVAARVVALHERAPVERPEDAAFAPDRLADQEAFRGGVVQDGRVELEELHPRDRGAGPEGHRDAVPGRDVRVARVEVDLAGAARGQQRRAGEEGAHAPAVHVEDVGAPDAVVPVADRPPEARLQDQVDRQVVLVERDPGVRPAALEEDLLDLAAGGVLRVQDAPARMPPLHAEVVALAGRALAREVAAEVDQFADAVRAAAHDQFDDLAVAEPVAGGQRVLDVQIEAVLLAPDRGDPPLRVPGVRGARLALGDDRDGAARRRLEREGEPGDSAADDEEVVPLLH